MCCIDVIVVVLCVGSVNIVLLVIPFSAINQTMCMFLVSFVECTLYVIINVHIAGK